jgi:ribosome-binding factor A
MSSIHDPQRDDDPSLFFGNGDERRTDWKARRLCRQVSEALQGGLSGECADEVLQQLWVDSVDPAPDASRLAVTVSVSDGISPAEAILRLERARGLLRSIVARAIHRKKVPELVFRIAGPEEAGR